MLAAKIIGVLDDLKLTVDAAQELTGVAAADFSRIRKANLARFTIDRLMSILSSLGQDIDIAIDVHPRPSHTPPAPQPSPYRAPKDADANPQRLSELASRMRENGPPGSGGGAAKRSLLPTPIGSSSEARRKQDVDAHDKRGHEADTMIRRKRNMVQTRPCFS